MPRTGRPQVERIIVGCSGCSNTVQMRASDYARRKSGRVFCSKDCQHRVGSKPRRGVKVACEMCGTELYSTPSAPRRFCSKTCHDASQRVPQVEKNCEACGKPISGIRPSQAATRRFCSKACDGNGKIARPLDRQHNGRPARVNCFGYVMVWEPDHPTLSERYGGWMLEHRLVAEQQLGRPLRTDEEVHHINRVKTDNRPENLAVLSGEDHAHITALDNWSDLRRLQRLVDRYRELHGDLPPE